jgi:hypothetical protein
MNGEAQKHLDPARDLAKDREERIQRQYEEASRFPGEFVVLAGLVVLFHSADREAAIARYEAAFDEVAESMPVLVEPGDRLPSRDPVARARSSGEPGA